MSFKKPVSVDNDIDTIIFAGKKLNSRYSKYLSHLSHEVVLKKLKLESFWRNCLILHMASSGVPRIEISNFMGISVSRINEIITNTKYSLLTKVIYCPLYHTKEIKYCIEQRYLKSHKFKYSVMELCREASELVLSYDTYNLRAISAGLKLSNEYWEKREEIHKKSYLLS